VQFLLRRDRTARFHFAALQSHTGRRICEANGLDTSQFDTFIYARSGRPILTRSDAALAVAHDLGWPWKLLSLLRVIPLPLRDAAYNVIARNRHRWFGKKDVCPVPTPEQRSRFLD
jgi:predicted DCC family thiol-disulfide oxidoreductase YuxK